MIAWAGVLIALCGVGHTLGALAQAVPRYAEAWFGWALWEDANRNLAAMTPTTAAFWFTVYSFGVPLILFGLLVFWLGRRHIAPPPVLAWALAAWTLVGEVLSGPSPLMFLLLAAVLLLVGGRRANRRGISVTTSAT